MQRFKTYNHTLIACYIGYITQAICNNFAPLLYLTFQDVFKIDLATVALLSTINFGIQILVDFAAARFAEKIGYRACMIISHVASTIGLCGLTIFPQMFSNPFVGLVLATFFYAVGGGLTEVLVSPIVEACPTDKKEAAMSLLHSFYCWGVVGVVLVSTLFFTLFGVQNWRVLAYVWALVPLCNIFNFCFVPINHLVEEGEGMTIRELCKNKLFWILVVLMICSGASELAMAQWASAFAESALKVSKTIGDLIGPCLFAVLMGCSRTFYARCSEKIDLTKFMLLSSGLCIVCYLLSTLCALPAFALIGCGLCGLSVGIMWPGSFSIAAKTLKRGGTAMFALLALAGDLGGSGGPSVVSIFSKLTGNLKIGLLTGIIFPICLILGLLALKKQSK